MSDKQDKQEVKVEEEKEQNKTEDDEAETENDADPDLDDDTGGEGAANNKLKTTSLKTESSSTAAASPIKKSKKSKTEPKNKSQKSPPKKKSKVKSKDSGKDKKSAKKIDFDKFKIGIVGGGKMAEAIARGLMTAAKIEPKKMYIAAKTNRNLDVFKSKGIKTTKRSYDIFGQYDCDIVFLCIHGYVIRSCFKGGGLRPFAFTVNYIPNQKHQLYVLSLIGGVPLDDIKLTMLDPENPSKYSLEMHRCMLNVGVAYGTGLGAIDCEVKCKKLSPILRCMLTSMTTELEHCPESMMDAMCTIGGAGLAFTYYVVQSLAEGGAKIGLNKNMATKLAAMALQTAAKSLLVSGKHPTEMQDNSTPPGGPAIYGIQHLEKADVAGGLKEAIDQAHRRLKELVDIEPGVEKEAKPLLGKR